MHEWLSLILSLSLFLEKAFKILSCILVPGICHPQDAICSFEIDGPTLGGSCGTSIVPRVVIVLDCNWYILKHGLDCFSKEATTTMCIDAVQCSGNESVLASLQDSRSSTKHGEAGFGNHLPCHWEETGTQVSCVGQVQ